MFFDSRSKRFRKFRIINIMNIGFKTYFSFQMSFNIIQKIHMNRFTFILIIIFIIKFFFIFKTDFISLLVGRKIFIVIHYYIFICNNEMNCNSQANMTSQKKKIYRHFQLCYCYFFQIQMTQDISKEVLALSIHVAAAASQITIQTTSRMILVTNSILESVEHSLQIVRQQMAHQQKHTLLDAVLEEHEEECMKDSKTKECYIEQQQKTIQPGVCFIEVIGQQISNENCNPNYEITPVCSTHSSISKQHQSNQFHNSCQIQEEQSNHVVQVQDSDIKKNHENQQNTPPAKEQRKLSLLSQQLSQIKIDKVKEAKEQKELMQIIESVDPDELIPRLKSIDVFDESKQESNKKDVLVFSDKQQILIDEGKQNKLKDSPDKSAWYASASVQYRATSYNTNESSNLDHHSYRWKSNSQEDENFFQDYGIPFQSSVFDFPFPQDFNTNSINYQQNLENIENKNQFTPKKPRLYCNNKKVPHWAENLELVSKYHYQQQNLRQNEIFGRMKNRVLEIAKQFSDNKFQRRGSSAQWNKNNNKNNKNNVQQIQDQLTKLYKMQDESIKNLKIQQIESAKKNQGLFAKTQYFLTSMKKKILNSFEKEQKFRPL